MKIMKVGSPFAKRLAEAINRKFDFNKTPLAPPGCKVLVHKKPGQRNSWDPHGAKGYYIGQATEHYRCFRTYVPKTQSERISDTVDFFPTGANTPIMDPADAAIAAAEALRAAMLQSNQPVTIDLAEQTLQRLSDIFKSFENANPNVQSGRTVIASEGGCYTSEGGGAAYRLKNRSNEPNRNNRKWCRKIFYERRYAPNVR
jgi:hypothetical protein